MAHYSGLYDIQMLAMLSCVFAASKRHGTSSVDSSLSLRAERRRIVSHATTNTAADVAPTNVCLDAVIMCCRSYVKLHFWNNKFLCVIGQRSKVWARPSVM